MIHPPEVSEGIIKLIGAGGLSDVEFRFLATLEGKWGKYTLYSTATVYFMGGHFGLNPSGKPIEPIDLGLRFLERSN